MKKRTSLWEKVKRPICGIVMFLCLLLLLGCTGTAENGGDLTAYIVEGSILLIICIAAGFVGGIFE